MNLRHDTAKPVKTDVWVAPQRVARSGREVRGRTMGLLGGV